MSVQQNSEKEAMKKHEGKIISVRAEEGIASTFVIKQE